MLVIHLLWFTNIVDIWFLIGLGRKTMWFFQNKNGILVVCLKLELISHIFKFLDDKRHELFRAAFWKWGFLVICWSSDSSEITKMELRNMWIGLSTNAITTTTFRVIYCFISWLHPLFSRASCLVIEGNTFMSTSTTLQSE